MKINEKIIFLMIERMKSYAFIEDEFGRGWKSGLDNLNDEIIKFKRSKRMPKWLKETTHNTSCNKSEERR